MSPDPYAQKLKMPRGRNYTLHWCAELALFAVVQCVRDEEAKLDDLVSLTAELGSYPSQGGAYGATGPASAPGFCLARPAQVCSRHRHMARSRADMSTRTWTSH